MNLTWMILNGKITVSDRHGTVRENNKYTKGNIDIRRNTNEV